MRLLVAGTLFVSACSWSSGDDDSSAQTSADAGPAYNCAVETRADTFVVGLDKVGTASALDFKLVSATPAPPARGDNTWELQVSAMTGGVVGSGITGASLTVTPFMPDHAHGTPIQVGITDKGNGMYELSPVNLWMPGLWQTTIQASNANGASDQAVFSFCLSE
jgi:hypothetical protein